MADIVPDLLEEIGLIFSEELQKREKIKDLEEKLKQAKATFEDADEYAVEVGDSLATAYQSTITKDKLPGGKMHYNIASGIIPPTLEANHDIITAYAAGVQRLANEKAELGLQPITPEIDRNRVNGLVDKVSRYDDFDLGKWILGEPIRNFAQNVVDEIVRANADFQYKSGLSPKITRKTEPPGRGSYRSGKRRYVYYVPCKWCINLAGTYDYSPGMDRNVFRRHEKCRCTVEYSPDGVKRQNVWSKKWNDKEKIEERKAILLDDPSLTPQERIYKANRPNVVMLAESEGVPQITPKKLTEQLTEDKIIKKISKNDNAAEGSCSSAALAYIGNKAGYDVEDFRGGISRDIFARRSSIKSLAASPGVQSKLYKSNNEVESAREALNAIEPNKEYYLGAGGHAAIVRKIDGETQYLELQSRKEKGWHSLGESELKERFGCKTNKDDQTILIEAESLQNEEHFIEVLSYLNTKE